MLLMKSAVSRALAISILLATCLSMGCNCVSPPTETQARQVLENLNQEGIKRGNFKIKDFRKTNGQMSQVNGVKIYKMDYEAEAEYLRDIKGFGMFGLAMELKHRKGDVVKDKGVLVFERTERGWKAKDGNVY